MAGRPQRRELNKTLDAIGGMPIVAELIADGCTIQQVAERLKVGRSTLSMWISSDPERRAALARAREEAASKLADEVLTIADESTNESERVSKLRIDARKWLASKWAPGIYGEQRGPLVQIDLAGAHLRAVRPLDQPAPQVITIDASSNDS